MFTFQNDDMILHPNDYEVPITSWLRRGEEDGDFEHPQLVDDWEICPDHIIMERFIGEGNFGEVYRGTLVHQRAAEEQGEEEEQVRQTHTVAIKVLRCEIQCTTYACRHTCTHTHTHTHTHTPHTHHTHAHHLHVMVSLVTGWGLEVDIVAVTDMYVGE